jgi:hypothetical protein
MSSTKTEHSKPSWFRWIDFVTLGGLAIVSLAIFIYALTHKITTPHATEGLCLLGTVALCFVGIYLKFCWDHKKWWDAFTWYPEYGFMISPGKYKLPDPKELSRLVKKTIDAWTPYHPTADTIVRSEVNWVWFEEDLNTKIRDVVGKLCRGYAIPFSHSMGVDYDTPDDTLELTAFEHELGHIIRGNATGQWDGEEHHKFMREHGLK